MGGFRGANRSMGEFGGLKVCKRDWWVHMGGCPPWVGSWGVGGALNIKNICQMGRKNVALGLKQAVGCSQHQGCALTLYRSLLD